MSFLQVSLCLFFCLVLCFFGNIEATADDGIKMKLDYDVTFLPNGTANVLTLRCSHEPGAFSFDEMFISDMELKTMISKYKKEPVTRWKLQEETIETTGCNDCENPDSDCRSECEVNEAAFLQVVFSSYAMFVREGRPTRTFQCFFSAMDADEQKITSRKRVLIRVQRDEDVDTPKDDIDFDVSAKYRPGGKLRNFMIRCALTTAWNRIDSIGVYISKESIVKDSNGLVMQNVENAKELIIHGGTSCTNNPYCREGETAVIDLHWGNWVAEKWGVKFTEVECKILGDKDGNGVNDTEDTGIFFRIGEDPESPNVYESGDEDGNATLLSFPTLNNEGDLSELYLRCTVKQGIEGITQFRIFNTNYTDEVYVTYTGPGSVPIPTEKVKFVGSFNSSKEEETAFAFMNLKQASLTEDFPLNTGDFIYLTCEITHSGGVTYRHAVSRIRGGRKFTPTK